MRLTAFLCLALALPATAQNFQELTRQSLEAYRASSKIKEEMRKATSELDTKRQGISSRAWLLRRPAPKKSEVDRQRERVKDLRARLAEAEAKLKAMEERATMTDEQIAAKKQELDAEKAAIDKQLAVVKAPFEARIKEAQKEVAGKSAQYEAMFSNILRGKAEGVPESVSVKISATPGDGFFAAHWKGADDRDVIWAHIRLRDLPDNRFGKPEMLDGKYRIQTKGSSQIWLWAGHYQIAFIPSNAKYKNEAKLVAALKALVDLEALASAKVPAPAKTTGK